MLAALGTDGLAKVLPYLQPALIDASTGHAMRDEEWTVAELRDTAAKACGVEVPPLQNIRRVTLRSILLVVVIALVAYTLSAMLVGVDFASIATELADANKRNLLGALLLSPCVQAGFAIGTMGASPKRLICRPVLMLQYAIQFIALTLPATAARIALEVRFFKRFGLPPASAVSIGVIDSFSGFAVLLVIGVVIALIVPRLRHRIRHAVRRLRTTTREQSLAARSTLTVLRRPRKVGSMILGNLIAQLVQAVILGLCLAAFGQTAHLSQLILINTAVSLFAGLMPLPGGTGVAEAGYTVGLQAIGIPSTVAMSTVIAFRLVTF